MTRTIRPRRAGFTLVELMVSAAICVGIMAILAKCFQIGIDTMRHMKSTGEMADQLRAAGEVIKDDLRAKHLLPPSGGAGGQGEYLRDLRYDQLVVIDDKSKALGAAGKFTLAGARPPQGGFFRIEAPAGTAEGFDADGFTSSRATNHRLHFTAIKEPSLYNQGYAATVKVAGNPVVVRSTAAEIAYFLDPQPKGTTPGGVPYFQLIRRQRLVREPSGSSALSAVSPRDPAVISYDQTNAVNTLVTVADPRNRLGAASSGDAVTDAGPDGSGLGPLTMTGRLGDDVLLSFVLSFEVKVSWTSPAAAYPPLVAGLQLPVSPLPVGPAPFTLNVKTDYPFDALSPLPAAANPALAGRSVFDSWAALPGWDALDQTTGAFVPSAAALPLPIRVKAVQIQLRVWDPKFQNARQATIVQDL